MCVFIRHQRVWSMSPRHTVGAHATDTLQVLSGSAAEWVLPRHISWTSHSPPPACQRLEVDWDHRLGESGPRTGRRQANHMALLIKEPACQGRFRDTGQVRKIPWRRARQPTPVLLPGESPRTGEPGGMQSMGLQNVDTTEVTRYGHAGRAHTFFTQAVSPPLLL